MGVNKVEINGETKLDLTQDTVSPNTLLKGVTAHDASGNQIVGTMSSGSAPSVSVNPSDITFIDYDGTVVAAWTLEELATKTALPNAPTHEGLVFQEWNYTLAELQERNCQTVVGALYDTDDGSTRIYIHLEEGHTSPMLAICPKGTATIDWGDGTALTTLTGTNVYTAKWTDAHEYALPGDYVITISMNDGGTLGFAGSANTNQYSYILRQSSAADVRNMHYLGAVKKIEFGRQVTDLRGNAFNQCYSLETIVVSNALAYILSNAFYNANSLKAIVAGAISSKDVRQNLFIGTAIFCYCRNLKYASIKLNIGNKVEKNLFNSCNQLLNVPDLKFGSLSMIDSNAFYGLYRLTRIRVPICTIISATVFANCQGMKVYDFTDFTNIPTIAADTVFQNIPPDCEIRVPASLVDEWKTAQYWSTHASQIVGV